MAYITPYQYYTNGGVAPTDTNWGDYQYVSIADVVNDFMLYYVGPDKQLDNVARHEVVFHAKKGIKLLNFDMSSLKAVEMEVGDDLKFILPSDYVQWVRISMLVNGTLIKLNENRTANSALGYLQDNNLEIIFDQDGEIMIGDSDLDTARLNAELYTGPGAYNGCYGYRYDDSWIFSRRFGVDPGEMVSGPTFRINNGVIDFSSGVSGYKIVIEYVSDGMANGDNTQIVVHKFAEEFLIRHIKWALLNQKRNIPQYEKNEAKKERKAEYNNAKIRLSGIHPSQLLMTLRSQGKWIK